MELFVGHPAGIAELLGVRKPPTQLVVTEVFSVSRARRRHRGVFSIQGARKRLIEYI